MEINLLGVIRQQLDSTFIQKAAAFIGEDSIATQKALDAVVPSVLGAVMNQSVDTNSATLLMEMLAEKHDGSILESYKNLLNGGSATQGLLVAGDEIVKNLFGNRTSGIVDWIASYASIKTGSASGLMSLVAPLILGVVGKQIAERKLSAESLMSLLNNQTVFISSALPVGLSSLLGLSNLRLDIPSVLSTAKAEKIAAESQSKSDKRTVLSHVLPWFVMIVVGLIGIFYLKMCNTKAPEPPQPMALPDEPREILDSVKKLQLPNGDIAVKTGSFIDQLFLEVTDSASNSGKPLTFDNVNFSKGATEMTEDSKMQLDDLVRILKGYPNINIKIEAHTDNDGVEAKNIQVSRSRAAAIKAYLVSQGIDNQRITTEGYGSSKPVTDNLSEEGKAKNRRIDVIVVKK